MKKKLLINIGVAVALIAVAFVAGTFVQKEREERQRAALLAVQKAQNEQREDELSRGWIELTPGTTREMLSPEFWKTELSGELLFTAEEIRDFRANNSPYLVFFDALEGREKKLRIYDLPDELEGNTVRTLTNAEYIDERAAGTVKVYIDGQTPDSEYWTALRDNCAFDLIPDKVSPRYCVCVKRDSARFVPADGFASGTADERYTNEFISAEVLPLTGAVVLHESRDGQWCFILNGPSCGWVKTDSLAFCTGREQWLEAVKPDDFLTVTACELTLDKTALPTRTEDLVLPMGTKISLVCDYDGTVNGRQPYDCYVTLIPCRDAGGALDWETVLVPVSKDVAVGYLPMTSDAVVEQAFKFLGRIYGPGGEFASVDCAGLVRQVYACFGFELQRDSASIGENFDLGGRDCYAMSTEKKLEMLKRMSPGALLSTDEHLMIYLGTVDNKPYVISACATFVAPGDNTRTPVDAYGVFVSNLELRNADGKTWLDSLRYFQLKDY